MYRVRRINPEFLKFSIFFQKNPMFWQKLIFFKTKMINERVLKTPILFKVNFFLNDLKAWAKPLASIDVVNHSKVAGLKDVGLQIIYQIIVMVFFRVPLEDATYLEFQQFADWTVRRVLAGKNREFSAGLILNKISWTAVLPQIFLKFPQKYFFFY